MQIILIIMDVIEKWQLMLKVKRTSENTLLASN